MSTPCYGQHELFDSMDIYNHRVAKAICDTCPIILECGRNLAETKKLGGLYGQPEGTWAGQLQSTAGDREQRRAYYRRTHDAQVEAEDARYDDDQARTASSDYKAGIRNDWTTTGHRVHQRRMKRQQRRRVA